MFPSCLLMAMGGLAQYRLSVLDMQTRSTRITMDLNYTHRLLDTQHLAAPSTHVFFQSGMLGGGQWEYLHALTVYVLLPAATHIQSCRIRYLPHVLELYVPHLPEFKCSRYECQNGGVWQMGCLTRHSSDRIATI